MSDAPVAVVPVKPVIQSKIMWLAFADLAVAVADAVSKYAATNTLTWQSAVRIALPVALLFVRQRMPDILGWFFPQA